jgi:DNA-binding CsgD family transcriptional regulator
MTLHADAPRITDSTSDASFAIDQRGLILSWNSGAEQLLGYPAREVLGKPCHEVICGSDIFGNRYCEEDCHLLKMAQKGEPVHCLQLDVVNAFDERVRLNVQSVVIPGSLAAEFTLLQILTLHRSANAAVPKFARKLSNREREVLDLLFSGADTEQIADSLRIAVATARTHIQNLLRRLHVHSRAQAVALAHRAGYR